MSADLHRYIAVTWIVFVIVWLASARVVKRTVRRQRAGSRFVHGGLLSLASLLLFTNLFRGGFLAWRFLPQSSALADVGLGCTVAGLAFAIWARLCLGPNWSGIVTIKQDHELIRSGPYARLRHPIYTGVELALLGTAIAAGEIRGLVAVGLALAGLVLKSRLEESFF